MVLRERSSLTGSFEIKSIRHSRNQLGVRAVFCCGELRIGTVQQRLMRGGESEKYPNSPNRKYGRFGRLCSNGRSPTGSRSAGTSCRCRRIRLRRRNDTDRNRRVSRRHVLSEIRRYLPVYLAGRIRRRHVDQSPRCTRRVPRTLGSSASACPRRAHEGIPGESASTRIPSSACSWASRRTGGKAGTACGAATSRTATRTHAATSAAATATSAAGEAGPAEAATASKTATTGTGKSSAEEMPERPEVLRHGAQEAQLMIHKLRPFLRSAYCIFCTSVVQYSWYII